MAKMKHIPANTPPDTGPKPASESLSVTIASSGPGQPVDATIVSPLGTQLAADSVSVTLASDSGTLPVNVQSSVLPTGAATEVKQDDEIAALGTANASLSSIDTSTSDTATAVQSIDTKTPALGQAAMAASVPVTIATDQSDVPVAISGTLPLPTGASTEAKQDDEITLLTSLDNKTTVVDTDNVTIVSSVLPTGAATEATLSSLNGKVVTCDTSDVTVSSSVLPAGAATEATLSAQSAKLPASLGAKASTGSLSVVPATDATFTLANASNSKIGRAKVEQGFYDYTSGTVTTSAYTEVITATTAASNYLEVFDSSGETIILAVGAALSEVNQFYIFPGGQGGISLAIPSGSRISIKSKTASASVGYLALNLYT